MKIENQLITLEQSKILKELNILQDSIWMWVYPATKGIISTTYGVFYHEQAKDIIQDNEGDNFDSATSSAFSLYELGVIIGKGTLMCEHYYNHTLSCLNSGLSFGVVYNPVAAAGFIITYIQNNPNEVSEINKRLTSNL